MTTWDPILQFGRGKAEKNLIRSNNAVIYTRVSSKEQAENNQSLETQKKYCLQYALKNDLNVTGFFGGTYESAKTDERNEFNRMIRFVKNQKGGASIILVYSLDRFSRTGDNAIFISSELKKQGIRIVSVTQPIDVSTHAGTLQQNIQFIFSKYDNDLRREKCVTGMKEKLLRGEWMGKVPVGYSYDRSAPGKTQKVVINKKGPLIVKAFELKARGLSNTEVSMELAKLGLRIGRKRFSQILRNPFYCGYISHVLLEGTVIEGKHIPLISKELFLEANDALKKNPQGYKIWMKNAETPLKNYVRCAQCGTPLTGYLVKRKKLHYYKCNKVGCKCNRSAKALHSLYNEFLGGYKIDSSSMVLLREQLQLTFENLTASDTALRKIKNQKLAELNSKLTVLDERYAFDKIKEDVYEKVSFKLKDEIRTLNMELDQSKSKISNPVTFIDVALKTCSNLVELWNSGTFDHKILLQNLVFPEGIVYDRQNDEYRTPRVNSVIELTSSLSQFSKGNKKGNSQNCIENSLTVVCTGIEPVLPE